MLIGCKVRWSYLRLPKVLHFDTGEALPGIRVGQNIDVYINSEVYLDAPTGTAAFRVGSVLRAVPIRS